MLTRPAQLERGLILCQRYRLEQLIGQGGSSSVFRATDLHYNRKCAVKILRPEGEIPEIARQRFAAEAIALGQLAHPNIVSVLEYNVHGRDTVFFAMEFLNGTDLYSLLQREQRLSWQRALPILRQIASGLWAAHRRGIIHRDIKPGNLLVCKIWTPDGWVEQIKLVDFGAARFFQGRLSGLTQQTAQGIIVGTPDYLSPEATLGIWEAIDAYTDQWSLAVVAYRMLSGQLPFSGVDIVKKLRLIRESEPPPLRHSAPDVPEHALRAIEIALRKRREERFATIQDFARALDGMEPLQGWPLRTTPSLHVVPPLPPGEAAPGAAAEVEDGPTVQQLLAAGPLSLSRSSRWAERLASPFRQRASGRSLLRGRVLLLLLFVLSQFGMLTLIWRTRSAQDSARSALPASEDREPAPAPAAPRATSCQP